MKINFSFVLALLLTAFNQDVFAQTKTCIFCEIAAGNVQQSQVVFKNNNIAAFMSHGPDNPGHLLIVPVKHATEFSDIPDTTLGNMMSTAKLLIEAVKKTDIKAEGFRIMMNSGKAAGQSVMHAHFHIIPRYTGEVLNAEHKIVPAAELDLVADKIRKALIK